MNEVENFEKQLGVLEHKLNFWGKIFPAVTLLLGAVIGATSTYLAKTEETSSAQNIRFAEIAISILAGEQSEDTKAGRLFAIRLLEKSTKVDMATAEIDVEAWANKGRIAPDRNILRPWPSQLFDLNKLPKCTKLEDGEWFCHPFDAKSDALERAIGAYRATE